MFKIENLQNIDIIRENFLKNVFLNLIIRLDVGVY